MSEVLKKNLYEISAELQQLIDYIEENGGEIDENIENELVIHENELRDKVEAYCNMNREHFFENYIDIFGNKIEFK